MNYLRSQKFCARASALATALCVAGLVSAVSAREPVKDKVVVIPLTDATLTELQEMYQLGQVLDQVKSEEAAGVVFDINVSGGDPAATVKLAREKIASIGIPVTAWINPSATGAGAIVALGSDRIFMSALGTIGGIDYARRPSSAAKSEDDEAMRQRDEPGANVSALRAAVRALAEAKGHDLIIASAFVDPAVEIDDTVEKDSLLTLTASQAGTFAERADSIDEVLAALAVDASTVVRIDGLRKFSRASKAAPGSKPGAEAEGGPGSTEGEAAGSKGDGLFTKAEEESFAGKIVVIEIVETDELMLTSRFDWFERAIQKASDDGASAVILDMNTPGGRLWETQELMMSVLAKAECQTITFVNPNAISAGAMIAISTDDIYMAPAAVIGAATAVSSVGGEIGKSMEGKIRSVQIAAARNVASLKGHNPDIAEAFVSPEKVLKLGPIDVGPDKPLAINADDAVQLINGKPLLAKGIATTIEDIIEQEGLSGEIYRPTPYGLEQFAMWVERLSFMLILVGVAGAYLEIKSPGFGIPGLISVLAFAVFFFGNKVAGNLAGWEVAVVFALGIVLVIVEIFVLPGAMIAGFLGFMLILGSLVFAMVDRVDFDLLRRGTETAPDWSGVFLRPALNLGVGLLLAGLLIIAAMAYLPETRFMNWMILDATVGGATRQGSPTEVAEPSLLGKTGVAFTELRPSGKANIDGEIVDVTSEGDFIEAGGRVTIVAHEGMRIVVEASA